MKTCLTNVYQPILLTFSPTNSLTFVKETLILLIHLNLIANLLSLLGLLTILKVLKLINQLEDVVGLAIFFTIQST